MPSMSLSRQPQATRKLSTMKSSSADRAPKSGIPSGREEHRKQISSNAIIFRPVIVPIQEERTLLARPDLLLRDGANDAVPIATTVRHFAPPRKITNLLAT